MKIIGLSLKNSTAVVVMIFLLIIAGAMSYKNLPLESFPEVKFPLLIVNTFYFGVSPEDIETLITDRIEKNLKSLDKIKKITSVSMEGLSSIKVEFLPGVDLDVARQKVKDKVDISKKDIPKDAEEPVIQEINISEFPIMYVSMSGDSIGLYNLKNIADDLKDKIKLVKGVLDVDVSGGLEREVQINVDAEKLRYFGVSLDDIINKIKVENITLPGGAVEVGNYNYSVRIPGEIEKPEDMFDWIVKEEKTKPIYLKDLATIVYRYKEIKSISRIDGKDAVTLGVKKRTGENIVTITDEVKKILEEEKINLPSNFKYVILGEQAKQIKNMVADLENNIITSLILVVGVLLFAMNFKNSLFVGLAIPLSMLLTFVVLDMMGVTLNMIVLFSLILALGMLVDNAIVLVDNCYRYMQLGKDPLTAAFLGAREIAMPITSSTLTTVAAFLPLMFWPGIMGDFMSYMPLTVSIVLGASLLVALTVNPVICSMYMSVKKKSMRNDRTKIKKHNFILNFYRRILLLALKNRILTMGFMIFLFISTFVIYGKFGQPVIFFPDVDPEMVNVIVKLPIGTKIEKTDEVIKRIENNILETKDMTHYVTKVGVAGREETQG